MKEEAALQTSLVGVVTLSLTCGLCTEGSEVIMMQSHADCHAVPLMTGQGNGTRGKDDVVTWLQRSSADSERTQSRKWWERKLLIDSRHRKQTASHHSEPSQEEGQK